MHCTQSPFTLTRSIANCLSDCAYSYGANDVIESCCFESYSYEARVPQGMFPAGDAPANYEVGGGGGRHGVWPTRRSPLTHSE